MNKKLKLCDNFTWCLLAGLGLTGISVLLFCLLGKDSIVTYHDQLDGEVLCYIYQAKYLFKGIVIPELMNGVSKTALTAPAPLLVLFYKVFSPFVSFVISQYFVMMIGFVGMYLLLTKWEVNPFIAAMSGVLFAYLPLIPVYGLAMYGIPLVLWAFLSLVEGEKTGLYLGVIVIYGLSSSLVLVGYAVLAVAVLLGVLWKDGRKNKWYWVGVLTLLLVYVFTNLSLFAQILGMGDSYLTHKEELKIASKPFVSTFWTTFINGMEHAASYQKWIVLLAFIIIVAGVFKKEWRSVQWKKIAILFVIALVIALLCALYSIEPIVELRRIIGGAAVWLQIDRIYWLYPGLWYAVLGLSLQWLWRLRKWLCLSVGTVVYIVTAITVLLAGSWKDNVKKIINPDAPGISWNDFYAEDVLTQVDEYIYETTGQSKSDYRVVSLGICPGAALYNGFYCLDGYSNNYPLEYKHAFRQIIETEIEKNDYLINYFDDWGNRCYLFSAEIPGYYTVEKGGFYFSDFSMNVEALEKLGGKYILSAAYIDKSDQIGLELLREEPFESEDSYYKIYLYGLEKGNEGSS